MVPSADRSRRPVAVRYFHKCVELALLGVATGTTTIAAQGAWNSGAGSTVRERVLIVESYLRERLSLAERRHFVAQMKEIAHRAKQEALLVVVDQRAFLVPGIASSESAL